MLTTKQQRYLALGLSAAVAGAALSLYLLRKDANRPAPEPKGEAAQAEPSQAKPAAPFRLLAEVKVTPEITVRKYVSERTGILLVLAKVPGPLVSGYFTLATETWSDDGCPHVLEHLVFLGSETLPYKGVLDEIANRSLAQGTNAWTDTDHTAYTITTAGSKGFLQMLPAYLDHILYPTLTEAGFITEVHHIDGEGKNAGVVYCEMQGRENTGESKTHLETLRALYPGRCSYKSETGGLLADLRALKSETVRQYHKQYYRPDNLCLIVTGQVADEELLACVAAFEQNRVLPKGPLPPMVRPWSSPLPPLSHNVQQVVPYSSEDEANGLATIAFRGPTYMDRLSSTAMDVLMAYLNESPISPLQQAFVECSPPMCSELDVGVLEQAEHVYMMEFEGVPQDMGEKLWPEFRRVLEKLCATGIDGDRMTVTLDRFRRNVQSRVESSPERHLSNIAIGEFLYGDRKDSPATFAADFDIMSRLEELKDKTSNYWTALIQKYFLDNYCVVSLGKPSKAFGRAQRETEKARVQRQKQQLGTEGLGRLRRELEDANAANSIPTPEVLLKANYHVPDVSVLPSIDIFTVRSGAALPPPTRHRQGHRLLQLLASQNGSDKSATGTLDGLPFFCQMDHIASNFVTIRALLDTQRVPAELRPYLTLYAELLFESCIGERGHEEVIKALQAETVEYGCSLGVDGATFMPGDFAEYVVVDLKVEAAKYRAAVRWLQELLYELRFTSDRLRVTLKRLLNSVPGLKNDAGTVLNACNSLVCFQPAANQNHAAFLSQQAFLRGVLAKIGKDSAEEGKAEQVAQVLAALNQLRAALTHLPSLRVFVAADWLQQEQLLNVWLEEFPSLRPDPPAPSAVFPSRRLLLEEKSLRGNYLVALAGTESAYLVSTVRLPEMTSQAHPDYAALIVLLSYLTECESPFWKRIRGLGYAYGYGLKPSIECGTLSFRLSRSSNLVAAYQQAQQVVLELAEGKATFTELGLDSAKSATSFGLVQNRHTIHSAASASMMDTLGEECMDNSKQVLQAIQKTTTADMVRVLKKYLLLLFSNEACVSVIVCDPAKADRIAHEMALLGRPQTVFPSARDFFLAQGVAVEEEDDEESGEEEESDESSEESSESSQSSGSREEQSESQDSFVVVERHRSDPPEPSPVPSAAEASNGVASLVSEDSEGSEESSEDEEEDDEDNNTADQDEVLDPLENVD